MPTLYAQLARSLEAGRRPAPRIYDPAEHCQCCRGRGFLWSAGPDPRAVPCRPCGAVATVGVFVIQAAFRVGARVVRHEVRYHTADLAAATRRADRCADLLAGSDLQFRCVSVLYVCPLGDDTPTIVHVVPVIRRAA